MAKTEKFRSRKFCLMLYPDFDETHKKALEYIKLNYDYASIVHDKDVYLEGDKIPEDKKVGDLKKSHTHVVLSFSNAKWNTAIAEELGITSNYIQHCRSLDNALEYLIHYNDDNKYQYDFKEVKGNLKGQLKKVLINEGKDENIKAYELMDYIDNFNGPIDEMEFFKYACEVGMYDVARRSAYILLRLIDKHNHVWSQVAYLNEKESRKYDY